MYSSTIQWDTLQKQVRAKAAGAKKLSDLKPALVALINGLRDHHGRVLDAKSFATLGFFTAENETRKTDTRERDLKTWKRVNDTSARFQYQLLDSNIAYLRVVGIGPRTNGPAEAKSIRRAIELMAKKKILHWIVDLRYNGGGNMNPMMEGLAPLVGDGLVGKLVDAESKTQFEWNIKKGSFYYGGFDGTRLPSKVRFATTPKVAVLTSRWTVSSGELVATTFKGRQNTRFFGEETGGYTTNTNWEIINNELILAISTGYFADRNGKVYNSTIPVDESIPFEIIEDIQQDGCVTQAKKWLMESSGRHD